MVETTTTSTTTTAAPAATAEAEPVTLLDLEDGAEGVFVAVPTTPEEIAAEGTELGLAGAHATGGNPPEADPATAEAVATGKAPVFKRVWSMDADHTVDNRHKPDQLHPDCSVLESGSYR